jgi:hypothetical protein
VNILSQLFAMLGTILLRGFSFVYASASLLAVLVTATVRDGAFRKRSSKEEIKELQIGVLYVLIFCLRADYTQPRRRSGALI